MNDTPKLLRHVAVIMDGNGRWAVERGLPRGAGHQAGVKTLRNIVEHCARRRIEVLTVFAFSSENWKRPRQEVDLLMELFLNSLKNEVSELHKNGIRLRFIGDRQAFPAKLQELITATESKTRDNTGLTLVIAANYGGRWDITDACRRISAARPAPSTLARGGTTRCQPPSRAGAVACSPVPPSRPPSPTAFAKCSAGNPNM